MTRRAFGWLLAIGLMAPLPAQADGDTGYLTVTSDPPAHVFVDGTDTGNVTPMTHYALPAGHHKVRLVSLDGDKKRQLGTVITAGEETTLNVSW